MVGHLVDGAILGTTHVQLEVRLLPVDLSLSISIQLSII